MVQVSIPSKRDYLFLPSCKSALWHGGDGRLVSIPSKRDYLFLRLIGSAVVLFYAAEFQSRLSGIIYFYYDTPGHPKNLYGIGFQSRLSGIIYFYLKWAKEWRWSERAEVSIPSKRDYLFLLFLKTKLTRFLLSVKSFNPV